MSIAWQPVDKGRFIMGSDRYDDEKSQHEVSLSYDYRISRYPITQAQYAVFVAEGGYTESCRSFWTQSGWQAKKERGWTGPAQYGHPFQLGNHPVVGVSWVEAVAFCRWLTERERQAGRLQPSDLIRLPTEAEWERAARGTDGRSYPWGNEPSDPDRLNYKPRGGQHDRRGAVRAVRWAVSIWLVTCGSGAPPNGLTELIRIIPLKMSGLMII